MSDAEGRVQSPDVGRYPDALVESLMLALKGWRDPKDRVTEARAFLALDDAATHLHHYLPWHYCYEGCPQRRSLPMPDQSARTPSPEKGPSSTPSVQLVTLADADTLRKHLDDLNEEGVTPVVVGWTAGPYPAPFLITLVGCYADSEDVFLDSPWQGDIQWSNGRTHCDECLGHVHGIEDLHYPVTVMMPDEKDSSDA